MAYYQPMNAYPPPGPLYHCRGRQAYGWNVMDYYPAIAPVQVVTAAPWGSYAEYLDDVAQRQVYDYNWYHQHIGPSVDPTEAHTTIQEALSELHAHVHAFKFPNRLDFAKAGEDGLVPPLSDTKRNSALNEHKKKLDTILETLEGVRPRGDPAVKRAKVDAIRRVKAEVAELKNKKAVVWYNQTYGDQQPRRRFWGIL